MSANLVFSFRASSPKSGGQKKNKANGTGFEEARKVIKVCRGKRKERGVGVEKELGKKQRVIFGDISFKQY